MELHLNCRRTVDDIADGTAHKAASRQSDTEGKFRIRSVGDTIKIHDLTVSFSIDH